MTKKINLLENKPVILKMKRVRNNLFCRMYYTQYLIFDPEYQVPRTVSFKGLFFKGVFEIYTINNNAIFIIYRITLL